MPHPPSVILLSNRGPVSFVQTTEGWETKRGAGGLAGAMDPVARRLGDDVLWIAAAISNDDREALHAGVVTELRKELGYPLTLVDIDPETYARYYDEVSNRMLWFANHCLWEEVAISPFGERELESWRDAFVPTNRRFAEAAANAGGEESLVLFQDYHLALAPRQMRSIKPGMRSLHFTHSSFCGPRGLERLPRPMVEELLAGMLGADLIGFHVPAWVRGFLEACQWSGAEVDWPQQTVTAEGRRCWVRSYPIPIDADQLAEAASRQEVKEWVQHFEDESPDILLVRADRCEPSKNIIRGFVAFGALLEKRSELRGRVRFVACLYPSRQSMPEYQEYAQRVERTADEINSRFPDSIKLYLKDDYDRTLAALKLYDVLVVNPVMDGMNLVSKEGPALNERDGVLVLSRHAGSFEELGEDVVVIEDPLDIDQTVVALEEAIDLPLQDRRDHAARLKRRAHASKPEDWIDAQISDLRSVRDRGSPEH